MCMGDFECTRGGHCPLTLPYCLADCDTRDDCRVGYACRDVDGDARGECLVPCADNGECSRPDASVCDTSTGACAPCAGDPDCGHLPSTPRCDAGVCVGCVSDDQCSGATPHCAPSSGECVECLDSGDCPSDRTCVDDECRGSTSNGGACDTNADCASGTCFDESTSGQPGGYCTESCMGDEDCVSGGHCGPGFALCAQSCADVTECRAGYACLDFDGDARMECFFL